MTNLKHSSGVALSNRISWNGRNCLSLQLQTGNHLAICDYWALKMQCQEIEWLLNLTWKSHDMRVYGHHIKDDCVLQKGTLLGTCSSPTVLQIIWNTPALDKS